MGYVCTRFLEKFDSWSWTWVDVLFLLIWCDVVRSIEFDPLILSRLDAYVWFEEAEQVMFLKLESWKKFCIFKEGSIFEESWSLVKLVEIGVLEESLYLKGASIFKDGWLEELESFLGLGRILSRPSGVKHFQLLQMRRTPLFIELSGRLYGLERCWVNESWLVHGLDPLTQPHGFGPYLAFELN